MLENLNEGDPGPDELDITVEELADLPPEVLNRLRERTVGLPVLRKGSRGPYCYHRGAVPSRLMLATVSNDDPQMRSRYMAGFAEADNMPLMDSRRDLTKSAAQHPDLSAAKLAEVHALIDDPASSLLKELDYMEQYSLAREFDDYDTIDPRTGGPAKLRLPRDTAWILDIPPGAWAEYIISVVGPQDSALDGRSGPTALPGGARQFYLISYDQEVCSWRSVPITARSP